MQALEHAYELVHYRYGRYRSCVILQFQVGAKAIGGNRCFGQEAPPFAPPFGRGLSKPREKPGLRDTHGRMLMLTGARKARKHSQHDRQVVTHHTPIT